MNTVVSMVTFICSICSPPRLKVSGTADLPDTFYEEDENGEENTITMNADGMYIAPIEETSL